MNEIKMKNTIDGLTRSESAIRYAFQKHTHDEPECVQCELLVGASCEWNENNETECHVYCVTIDGTEYTIHIIV